MAHDHFPHFIQTAFFFRFHSIFDFRLITSSTCNHYNNKLNNLSVSNLFFHFVHKTFLCFLPRCSSYVDKTMKSNRNKVKKQKPAKRKKNIQKQQPNLRKCSSTANEHVLITCYNSNIIQPFKKKTNNNKNK